MGFITFQYFDLNKACDIGGLGFIFLKNTFTFLAGKYYAFTDKFKHTTK